ncbi:hypothetical protein Scep_002542 [Stephania cephalantha]|uniref:Uncharacterized protein n=1 Tax=Stephania cephalantha TaxID=152367 RepID=A0AAP0Q8W0_9MAGN
MEKISNSVLAARRESKSVEEGRRSVQRRERRMGTERGREAVGAKKEDDGENLQLGAGSDERVETGGGGKVREEVRENLSKSALAARRESEPAEDGRRSVQRRCLACRGGRCVASRGIHERPLCRPSLLLLPHSTNPQYILTHLKTSLSKTLTLFHPLAGRLNDSNHHHIFCNNEGVKFETSHGVKLISTFDEMGIRDDFLRGIYAYEFEKLSAIQ